MQLAEKRLTPLEVTKVDLAKTALKSKLIGQATEEELKIKLVRIYLLVGLRQQHFPADEEKTFVHQYIFQNYGNKTLDEFELAFSLAIKGQLNLKLEDYKVFDQFSCEYISRIMNAYRDWLKHASELAKTIKETPMIDDKTEITPMEMIEWIEEYKQKEDIILDLIPISFYTFLTDTGIIKITNEQKWEVAAKATQSIKTDLMNDIPQCKTTDALNSFRTFEKMEKDGFTGKFKSEIQNRAKRMIVYDYLTKK